MRAVGAGLFVLIAALVIFFITIAIHAALAKDMGRWEHSPPEIRKWFQSLMQPDSLVPCCGEGDGYWADEYHLDKDGNLIATITDDRDDLPLQRFHVEPGTRYVVPPNKIVDATKQNGNPTGHTIIFLGTLYNGDPKSRPVLCWVGGGGY